MKRMAQMRRAHGFTLLELLVVLVFAGITVALLFGVTHSNWWARNAGGTTTYQLPPNTKLVNVTWNRLISRYVCQSAVSDP